MDFATAVYRLERELPARPTNPIDEIEMNIPLRDPAAWTGTTLNAATRVLELLGTSRWGLEIDKRRGAARPPGHEHSGRRRVERVILFSGGVDSACGAATLAEEAATTQLVGFYTRQRARQLEIASSLGHAPPIQWSMRWRQPPGSGHAFYYRSLLFLVLAGVVAESWGCRTITQFENGVLATAVPPAASWRMTKHAHPALHEAVAQLLGTLLGGRWRIENPFLLRTKREGVQAATRTRGGRLMAAVLARTETCWFHYSNRIVGGRKRPGRPCGVCIPCIVRRTALRDDGYQYDLRQDAVRNHPDRGRAFRSYFAFVERIRLAGRSASEFYAVLPEEGRDLLAEKAVLTLEDLHRLFRTFSAEFRETYLGRQ